MEQITKLELKVLIKEVLREVIREEIELIEALARKSASSSMDKDIKDLDMSNRLYDALTRQNIRTLSQIKTLTRGDFRKYRNTTENLWEEILELLEFEEEAANKAMEKMMLGE